MGYTMTVNNLKVKHRISILTFIVVITSLPGCNESAVKRDPIAPPVSDAFKPDGHILSKRKLEDIVHQGASIPSIVNSRKPVLPRLYSKPKSNYSLTAANVPVAELLFQIAKDAGKQIDIYSGISGRATINALNQPLDRILDRLSEQSGFIYALHGNVIQIKPDIPVWRNYNVDYVNINKTSEDKIQMQMSVSSGESSTSTSGSSTDVTVKSEHNFWSRLKNNIEILAQLDPFDTRTADDVMNVMSSGAQNSKGGVIARNSSVVAGASSGNSSRNSFSTTSKSVNTVINPEAGVISVYTTNTKHKAIKQYILDVSSRAQRQVLIEATVVEVLLNDRYQAGIDWSKFGELGFTSDAEFTAFGVAGPSNILDQLSFLSTFGDSKVLSSPKIMAINNQTALLKVVNNLVYFTVDVNSTPATVAGADPTTTYQTEIHTVPVGFTMSVTPFVSEAGDVTLNVRPTISRKIGEIQDPNPELSDIESVIPIIQEKEMSSVLKLKDRQTAIIGGLIEDNNSNSRIGLPWLSGIPVLGDLFSQRDDQASKSELVIFIRPVIIKNPDVDNGDLQQVGRFLKTSSY
jgi:type II secretory pathway component GspD/PulD (secretin)